MSLQEIDRPRNIAATVTSVQERKLVRGNEPRWQTSAGFYWAANTTVDAIPPGAYTAHMMPSTGPALSAMTTNADDLLHLPDSPSGDVLSEIRRFWTLESEFTKRGLIFKRGVLLWGPPGTGKTATVKQLADMIVGLGGICIFGTNISAVTPCLQLVRKIEGSRPIVVVLEDIDSIVENGGESVLLALLDGENQVSNVAFVATTNYINRLPPRIVNRPSRFDCVMKIGYPSDAARHAYLMAKEPSLAGREIGEWIAGTEGFSIAHLRELIILCRCYQQPLAVALERLNKMRKGVKGDE